ncbi:MAG TPA: inorganic phosphate transporter, partial [bacterium]|nr:inorganic phosphate transporter [bacterium]
MPGLSTIFKLFSWKLFGGLFLGWGVGANDSANIFGTAVATNSVKYKTAVILIAIFVVLGSCIHGRHLFEELNFKKAKVQQQTQSENKTETNNNSQEQNNRTKSEEESVAFISTLAAAFTVLLATYAAIPASTSQAAIGAMVGIAIGAHTGGVDWSKFSKMFLCWVLNPIGSAIISIILFIVLSKIIHFFFRKNFSRLNRIYKVLLIIAGCYGAYELGANNVVVTTAPYYNAGMFGDPAKVVEHFWQDPAFIVALIGSLAIALGVLTYNKKVIYTVD